MSVVVTGFGAVSGVGTGRAKLWEALAAGLDGIRPIRRFSIDGVELLGALVPEHAEPRSHRGLSIEMGNTAAAEALGLARLDGVARTRIALVVGTSIGDELYEPTTLDEVTRRIGDAADIRGPRITVSTACASSANAIGIAKDLLDAGVADVVLAGGTDVLTPEIYAGFRGVGVLSTEKCAPFSVKLGTTLGEGAGFVVLERPEDAQRRGATAFAAIAGYGLSADAFHETSPDPAGGGVARAIASALQDGDLAPTDIDYINAHGTGTQANDPAEWRAIVRVFGAHADKLPVSSSKAMLGHAQGAAGVLELLVTLVAMREGVIPQTLHFTKARAHAPRDPVGQPLPRAGRIRRAVCTSSAFGGANAAIVLEDTPRASKQQRRDVFVRGVGAVGAFGHSLDALTRAIETGVTSFDAAPFGIDEIAPTIAPRGLDPSTKFLTAAATLACADAGDKLARERTGLIVGASAVSPATADEFRRSIAQRGYLQLSAPAFARMVLNAPAGACGKLLSLKGPTSTVDTGEGSGLFAIIYAAHLLATRTDADAIVTGAFDEIDRTKDTAGLGEGAACAVLGTTGTIRIAGWGLAGAGDWETACAGLSRVDAAYGDVPAGIAPRVFDPRSVFGHAPASSDVLALVTAVLALRRGDIRTALIGSSRGTAMTAALVLTTVES